MLTITAHDSSDRTSHTAELAPVTEAGERMAAIPYRYADEFAEATIAHDRAGTFAVAHLQKLMADGFLVGPIPTNFGGGGVTSARDLLVATSRLARVDVSTAIGVNMHIAVVANLVRAWSVAVNRWDERRAERISSLLNGVVAADVVFASAVSEPGAQDLTRPATTAVLGADGWRVTGRKAFATMAAHATMLSVGVTFVDGRGDTRYGFAMIPADAPGVVHHDDWDALGMRASASGSVSFDNVLVGNGMLSDCAPAGRWTAELMERYLLSGALHAAASLGIAEGAHAHALGRVQARSAGARNDAHTIGDVAANVVDLTAMRAALDRAGQLIDAHHGEHPMGDVTGVAAQRVTAEVQAVKAFINQAAVRVVDRALALTGGAGYRAADPLAKAWRDVRAGAFMHPLGANRASTFLANAELGWEPT